MHRIAFLIAAAVLVPSTAAFGAFRANETDQAKFERASDLLRHGQDYNAAILILSDLVQRDPSKVEYNLALGCAYASRFASIAVALERQRLHEEDTNVYKRRLRIWQRTHERQGWPLFGLPAPTPPPSPYTADDHKPFALDDASARAELSRLALNGFAAFDKVRQLEAHLPDDKLVSASYTRGWGLFLFYRFRKGIIETKRQMAGSQASHESDGSPTGPRLDPLAIAEAFRVCTVKEPKRAANWQSLGFAQCPSSLDDHLASGLDAYVAYNSKRSLGDADRPTESELAFIRAAGIRPGDIDIEIQAAIAAAPSHPEVAVAHLQKALSGSPGNALLWYLLAEQLLRQAEVSTSDERSHIRERALEAMEKGNGASQFHSLPLALPVPTELRKAWDMLGVFGIASDDRIIDGLFLRLCAVMPDYETQRGAKDLARIAADLSKLGLICLSHFDCSDLNPGDPYYYRQVFRRGASGIGCCEKVESLIKKAAALGATDATHAMLEANTASMEIVNAWEWELSHDEDSPDHPE